MTDDVTDDVTETEDTEGRLLKLAEFITDGACLGDSFSILQTWIMNTEYRYPCEHMLPDMIDKIKQKAVDDLIVQYMSNVSVAKCFACNI